MRGTKFLDCPKFGHHSSPDCKMDPNEIALDNSGSQALKLDNMRGRDDSKLEPKVSRNDG